MKLISAIKTSIIVAGVSIMLKDLFDWLHGDPQHLVNSRSKALDDLLHKSGYVPTHKYGKGREG